MKIFESIKRLNEVLIGMNERNIGLIYPNNARKNYKYADDKSLAKDNLEQKGLACPKTYAIVDSIGQIEPCWASASLNSELVIKPAKGAGGKGIMILKRKGAVWYSQGKPISQDEIFYHTANVIFGLYSFGDGDVAMIEAYVRPHEVFQSIYPEGVPDIRIILLKGNPLMGMLRMPTAQSGGKANLHQGGLGIGIDLDTGILQEAYDGKQHVRHHPDTSHLITGVQLPFWEDLIGLSISATQYFPLDYLGVDLVIDQDKGPMIMGLNVRPGLAIQLANKRGLKEAITSSNFK